jgi:acetyl-CoA synthetase
MKFGEDPVNKYDLSSLRVLGTVGEPINPEAWIWYYEVVGKKSCPIVDTYWQTETGGHMLTPIPGASSLKPGSATGPFFGIKPLLLDAQTGKLVEGNGVNGVLVMAQPWPSMARTVYNNHERYLTTYMSQYPGYYFTGDGAIRDKDGFLWITGRVDDVLNVSGHRLGTAEIESALVQHESCVEAACVGIPDEIKGQSVFAYCILGQGITASDDLAKSLRLKVREVIGPFAAPKQVLIVPGLPKTRSGKIMRRILRKIATNAFDALGDVTTLGDPSVVAKIIDCKKAAN